MAKRSVATVAGAGALGLSCAVALADAGFEVTVCDPAAPLSNASAVAGGMLAPAFEAVLDDEAAAHFDLLLAARTGVRLDRSGALAAGRAAWLHEVAGGMARLGLHATEIPRAAAQALAPGLSPDLEGVVLNREDWRLDPQAALAALRTAASAAGVMFSGDTVRARGEADLLVLALGAAPDAAELAPELAALAPIKGHILRISDAPLPAMTLRGEGIYVTPADGALAVGATMEAGVSDPRPDPAKAKPLLALGAALVSGLAGARRNGWLLAPLVARIVADLATGRDPGPFATRLAAQRFAS